LSLTLYLHDLPRWAIRPLGESLAPRGPVEEVIVHRKLAPEVWAQAKRTLGEALRLTPLSGMRWRAAIWRAQATSLDVTETLWRELSAARQIGKALNDFFQDPHGEYALRKALILDVEWRLEAIFAAGELAEETGRTVRLAAASPLDGAILDVLSRRAGSPRRMVDLWDREPYRRAERRHAAGARFRGLARSVLWLGGVPLRRGLRWRAPRVRPFFKVASDNKWAPGFDVTLGRADDVFLVDGERIRIEDALVLLNPHQPGAPREAYTAAGIAVVEPERLPVPLDFWIRDATPRLARFLVAALAVRGPFAGVVVRKAIDIALAATAFRVLLQHVGIGVLTSVVEYDPMHVIKTLLLNRDGGAQVRLPHSHMDYPGAALAYLHYDIFWSAGEYLPTMWGGSWSPHTRAMSVGLLFGHMAEGSAENASPGALALVSRLRSEGRRVVTVFTSSNAEATYAPQANSDIDFQMLTLTLNGCARLDDVVVLIKPKLGHDAFLDTPRFQELLGPHIAAGRVHLVHPRWSTGCAAGYLLHRSEVNVAYGGSVVIEALLAAVPVIVPLVGATHMTPFVRKFLGTVFFEDDTEFQEAFRALLDGKRASSFDVGVVREWFDPFEDRGAIQRMRDAVAGLLERCR